MPRPALCGTDDRRSGTDDRRGADAPIPIDALTRGAGSRSRWASSARTVRRMAILSIARFFADRCLIGASALSYATLVSMVPLTAVALVMFAGLPMFAVARDRLLSDVIGGFAPSVGSEAAKYFAIAANNAAQTTILGLVSLVATSILLLATIEDQMNAIFRVTIPRSWSQRVIVYWTVLTLGPLLLGLGISASAEAGTLFDGLGLPEWLGPILSRIFSFSFEATALSLLYGLMPQRKVHWRSALAGAIVAAILLQFLKTGFSVFVLQMSSYSRVYGALAGVPIFLLWMYIFWLAVLAGAELSAALNRRRMPRIMWVGEVKARKAGALPPDPANGQGSL